MPNWCDSDLTIEGSPEDIIALTKSIASKKYPIDFDKIIPYPKDKKYKGAKGYSDYGYTWCCENWGTKWPAGNFSDVKYRFLSKKKAKWSISFNTAWAPPVPIMNKLADLYPKLKFTLKSYECGMGYKSVLVYENGSCVREETSTYSGSRGG